MGKQGPCCHCGATSTPLWRNGPPEKPVLCNACGSRWRTKGSLRNYFPNQARGSVGTEGLKVQLKSSFIKPKDEWSLKKTKNDDDSSDEDNEVPLSDQCFMKNIERDTSYRSSSLSAVSCSDSCAPFSASYASDVTGSSHSDVWVSLVPSKKRTCRSKPSPIEKLTKDLYSIMQEQQSSCFSGGMDGDLIYHSGIPIDSFETGYGSALLRLSNSESVEDDTEACSVPVKPSSCFASENCIASEVLSVFSGGGTEEMKQSPSEVGKGNAKSKIIDIEKFIIQDKHSPLLLVDLEEICNYDSFMAYLTSKEQEELLKYLPSSDIDDPPTSIRNLFKAPQFMEACLHYQRLLQEGLFDRSLSGASPEECRTLEGCVLGNLVKSAWVDPYRKLKMKTGEQREVLVSKKKISYDQIDSTTDETGTIRAYKRARRLGGVEVPKFNCTVATCPIQRGNSPSPLENVFVEDYFDRSSCLDSGPCILEESRSTLL